MALLSPPPAATSPLRLAEAEAEADPGFLEELRQRNIAVLSWSIAIFDAAYVGWTVFDWLLEPEHWRSFLAIRVAVALFGTAVALWIRRPGRERYTWEAFWLWLFVCGAGIAVMLPQVESLLEYTLGFSLILYGAGLLPFWRPTWAATNILAIIGSAGLAFLVMPSHDVGQDLVAGLFFVLTGAAASLVMATFKHSLLHRDYLTRTELGRTSDKLAKALKRLEALDRMKNRFFANISHELRSPLTLILAPVQLLLREELPAEARRNLRAVEQNADHLLRLIDDLLDLSRLDTGALRLKLADLDLGAVVQRTVERARPAAEARGQRLSFQSEADLPAQIGDEHRMEIVVGNLVGNALKYTPDDGQVQVRVSREGDSLRVDVQDDGPGIPPQEVEKIFDRFFQSERTEHQLVGGVGIGLALAKELVELHGGRMMLETRLGAGSTFSFTVPLGRDHYTPDVIERRSGVVDRRITYRGDANPGRRATDVPPPTFAMPAVPGDPARTAGPEHPPLRLEWGRKPRVLLAEDKADLRDFVATLLARDFEVTTAADGDRAWELVQEERPDLVLSDVMMPGRSGRELCRAIKDDPQLHSIPVILLTARAGSDATVQAYAHGADDFVAKPFHPRVLIARVNAQLRLRALSARLAQREKLAAVGTLTAGILHEVRNPVNALMSAARTLGTHELPPQAQRKLLGVVQDAAERINRLTTDLDAHIRPAEGNQEGCCDIMEGLGATLRLVEHRTTDLQVHIEQHGQGCVRASPGPLNQVFLNLVDNALKAGAGHLWIRVEAQGDPIRVVVADDGKGIPPDALDRIFDPFFTTAEPGAGTGLGLFLSREIVQRAGGSLRADHRPEGGAVFIIELPAETAASSSGPANT